MMRKNAEKYRLEKRSPEAKIFGQAIHMIQVRRGLSRQDMAARLGLTNNSYREMIFGGWLPIVEGAQWKHIYEILQQDFKEEFQVCGAPLTAYNERRIGREHVRDIGAVKEEKPPRKELGAMLGEAFGNILHHHGLMLAEAARLFDVSFLSLKSFRNGRQIPSRTQGVYGRILEGLRKNCQSGFREYGAPLEAFACGQDMNPFLESYRRRLCVCEEKRVERMRSAIQQRRHDERIGELLTGSFRKVVMHHGYGKRNGEDNPMSRHRIVERWGITIGSLQYFLRSQWSFDPQGDERWQKVLAGLRADCAEGLEKFGAPLIAFDKGLPLDSFLPQAPEEEPLEALLSTPRVRLRDAFQADKAPRLMADPASELRKNYPYLCAERDDAILDVYARLAAQEEKQGEVDEVLGADKWRRDVSSFVQENDLTDPLGGFSEISSRVSLEDMLQVKYADPETPLPVFKAALEEICLKQAILTPEGQAKRPEGHRAKLLLRRYERLLADNG